jgi:hypothetical protein
MGGIGEERGGYRGLYEIGAKIFGNLLKKNKKQYNLIIYGAIVPKE